MSWIEGIIFGIVSGLTEFLPVSSRAHQAIMLQLFGLESVHGFIEFSIHVGCLVAVILSSVTILRRLSRDYKLSRNNRKRRRKNLNTQSVLDVRFVKVACVPVLIAFIFYVHTRDWWQSIPLLAAFLLLNGILLHIPMYLAKGNKDSRNMSSLDGVLFGLCSALGILPGVSRVGAGYSVALARGADSQNALKWSLLVSIPALIVLSCFDLYDMFAVGLAGTDFFLFIKGLLCGVFSYLGARLSISFMRILCVKSGLSAFSYYSLGAALFAFILYLY